MNQGKDADINSSITKDSYSLSILYLSYLDQTEELCNLINGMNSSKMLELDFDTLICLDK